MIATTESIIWPVNQLTRLRDDYGYDVAAVVSGEEGPLVDALRAANIPVHVADFNFPSLPSIPATVRLTLSLARLFQRERFDIVQTALWHSMVLGRFAAWLADVPVRLVMHAGPYYLDGPIHRWIDGSTTWMETFLIGCCASILDGYRQLGVQDDRLALVYYGPDETRFDPDRTVPADIRAEYGWPADTPIIVHVAWFYPRIPDDRWAPMLTRGKDLKGREDLIHAAPHILREFPHAKILLVGTAFVWQAEPLVEELKDVVHQLGLDESVIFTGYRPSVNDILRAADVAVQPSLSEGCGGTFEALLLERPTVGTRVGGIPDMVIDGKTGVLVNPADPQDLARGICELLRDPGRARALGTAGRQHVLQTATLSKTVADLDRLYRQWLFPDGTRRTGYRRRLLRKRLLVLIALAIYLNLRLHIVEYRLIRRWREGWRPWHLVPHIRWSGVWRTLMYMKQHGRVPHVTPSDLLWVPTPPGSALAARWISRIRRGEAPLTMTTLRAFAGDVFESQPLSIQTSLYQFFAARRGRRAG